MRIAVVGAKLQVVEVIYLAQQAGYETILYDRHENTAASAMCSSFVKFDFTEEGAWPVECGTIDIIFPALENLRSLGDR